MKIIKNRYSLLILLLILVSSVAALSAPVSLSSPNQQATMAGQLVDAAGNVLPHSTVFIRGEQGLYNFTVDADGRWTSTPLPMGRYALYAINLSQPSWPQPQQIDLRNPPAEILLTVAPRSNAVAAGDFESAMVWQEWQRLNGTVETSSLAFDGAAAAQLGTQPGKELTCSQNGQPGQLWTIQQTVTVPQQNPTLSFLHQISTSQTSFDYAWFEAVLIVNGQPQYLIPWGEQWQATDWSLASFDLAAWRGQTVTLLFQAVNCSTHSFTLALDRVALGSVGTRVPNPNPNPTMTPQPGVTPAPGDSPLPVTPVPNATFEGSARQLTACENQGKHHLFIYVEDETGAGISDVTVRVFWPDGEAIIKTGTKMEHAGLVDFPMFKGSYWIEVVDSPSDVVGPLTPDIPQDVLCEETGNPVGNSLFHYSYDVLFTRK